MNVSIVWMFMNFPNFISSWKSVLVLGMDELTCFPWVESLCCWWMGPSERQPSHQFTFTNLSGRSSSKQHIVNYYCFPQKFQTEKSILDYMFASLKELHYKLLEIRGVKQQFSFTVDSAHIYLWVWKGCADGCQVKHRTPLKIHASVLTQSDLLLPNWQQFTPVAGDPIWASGTIPSGLRCISLLEVCLQDELLSLLGDSSS